MMAARRPSATMGFGAIRRAISPPPRRPAPSQCCGPATAYSPRPVSPVLLWCPPVGSRPAHESGVTWCSRTSVIAGCSSTRLLLSFTRRPSSLIAAPELDETDRPSPAPGRAAPPRGHPAPGRYPHISNRDALHQRGTGAHLLWHALVLP